MSKMHEALDRLSEATDAARRAAFDVLDALPAAATRPDFRISDVLQAKATCLSTVAALETALTYNEGQKR